MPNDATLSIRLPEATRKALDAAAKRTRRSRAYIVNEALNRHLEAVAAEAGADGRRAAFDRILSLAGSGVARGQKGMSDKAVTALLREIRGDD